MEADALIVAGMGGITDAFPDYARELLMTLSLALRYRKPVFLVGQGIGPLENADLRELAGHILSRVDVIALRESVTAAPLLQSLGVPPGRITTTGDDAIETAYRARSESLGSGLGINIRASNYSEIDAELVATLKIEFRQALRHLNATAVPVPISRVEGESDVDTIGDLIGGYDGPSATFPESSMPNTIIEQLHHCRILVCGSYHAAVFACSCGIPSVCLTNSSYYDAKFGGLAALFGDGCDVISLREPDFALRLREAIRRNWTEAERLRPFLLQRAEAQIAAGYAAYQRIHDLISRHLT
jgi:colanic acid/amylovoran biosynthesis protein